MDDVNNPEANGDLFDPTYFSILPKDCQGSGAVWSVVVFHDNDVPDHYYFAWKKLVLASINNTWPQWLPDITTKVEQNTIRVWDKGELVIIARRMVEREVAVHMQPEHF